MVPPAKGYRSSRIFRVSSELSASYLAPLSTASYSTKSGYAAGAALFLHHERKKNPFFGGLTFDYLSQNTSISTQTYMSVGLKFGFSFDVADEDAKP